MDMADEKQLGVTIDMKEVRAALKGIPRELRRELREPLKRSGAIIVSEMCSRAPRKTGRLAAGVKARTNLNALTVRVMSTARTKWGDRLYDYGRALEFDAKRYGGRFKWFYPSFDAKKDEARELFWQGVKRVVDFATAKAKGA